MGSKVDFEQRCGHLGGKELVSTETFVTRVAAAAAARRRLGSDIVIIARTDALQTDNFDEAVRRLKAAIAAGADVAFLEGNAALILDDLNLADRCTGLTSREEAREVCKVLAPTPVLLNMVEHGATPSLTPAEAKEMGFRIIIFPFGAIAPAYDAIRNTFQQLKDTGKTGLAQDFTPRKLFSIVGLKQAMAIDLEAGGSAYGKV